MLDQTLDTHSLSAFRDNPSPLIQQIKTTQRPVTLTIDGQPQVVLQDPAEYQRLLDLAALADAGEGIRQGLADVAAGRIRQAKDVFDELREKYGIPR